MEPMHGSLTLAVKQNLIALKSNLLHCPVCGEARETIVNIGGIDQVVHCICRCDEERYKTEENARLQKERLIWIEQMKIHGLQDPALRNYTFENDFGDNPVIDKARIYVQKWNAFRQENIGLLLFGPVGTGKSFFAGCVANALLDKGIPVLMTNFPKVLNTLGTFYCDERNSYINSLNAYDLLIIDDLGAERETDYTLEQIYSIIDSRYRSRKPLIITTNLTLQEMKGYAAGSDLRYARIYDRVLEMCQPIVFTGKNYRQKKAADTYQTAVRLLSEE